MKITRIYYNAADDLIRLDALRLDVQPISTGIVTHQDNGLNVSATRRLSTQTFHISSGGTPVSRVVDKIEITGAYDEITVASGAYTSAAWNRGDDTQLILDMSDLPVNGDTV